MKHHTPTRRILSATALAIIALAPAAQSQVVAQFGDLFPSNSTLPGTLAWPGNNGKNTNMPNINAPNALNIPSTDPAAGTWRVGWVETSDWSANSWGNPTSNPRTMGGWTWPNSDISTGPGTLGGAQGYSWAGNHDVGWVEHVGMETGGNLMNVRFNGGSLPLLQWTADQAGTFDVSFTVGNASSSWANDYIGFGIWSTATNSYVYDNATMGDYAPNSGVMINTSPTPSGSYTVTASNVTLAAGQSLWFVARVGGATTAPATGYQFQNLSITDVNTAQIVAQFGDLFPSNSSLPGAKAWPGNNGLNTNAFTAPNAANLASTSAPAGNWRVGWVNWDDWNAASWGNPTAVPYTMGGWIWPNVNSPQPPTTLGAAQGYSWAGNHDNGWVNHVGMETINNIMNVRFNGGSYPLLQWTAAQAGTFNVSFTVGNAWSNWTNDYIGFGIWSTATNSYVYDTSTMGDYAPNSTMISTTPTPSGSYTVTATGVTLGVGDSLWFVARVGGNTYNGNAGYQFQGLTITAASPASAYNTWATTTHSLANPAFDFDSDGDIVDNGLEWILGGNPNVSDTGSILPSVNGSASNGLTLVFNRNAASVSETTLTVEWDTDLDAFAHSVTVGAADSGPLPVSGVTVNVDAPSAGKVTVNIPASNAPGGKLFARLKAVQN